MNTPGRSGTPPVVRDAQTEANRTTARRPLPVEGVFVEGGRVVIHLSVEGAEWLAGELPRTDMFTAELRAVIDQLRSGGDT